MIPVGVAAVVAFVVSALAPTIAVLRRVRAATGDATSGRRYVATAASSTWAVLLVASSLAFLLAHVRFWRPPGGTGLGLYDLDPRGWLVIGTLLAMGFAGVADSGSRVQQHSFRLLVAAVRFGIPAALVAFLLGTGGARRLGFGGGTTWELDTWLYVTLALATFAGVTGSLRFTDRLEGGALTGYASVVFAAYAVLAFWMSREAEFYSVDGALSLAVVAAALSGASAGALWWDAAPGSEMKRAGGADALAGAMAAIAMLTNTQLLLLVIAGPCLVMAARKGFLPHALRATADTWVRTTSAPPARPSGSAIVRFWIASAIIVVLVVGAFYADWAFSVEGVVP